MENKTNEIIKDFLIDKLDPSFILIFGSYAKGNQRDDSDIDIAYYPNDSMSPSPYENFILAQELARILNKEIDLINARNASTVFLAQIYTTGSLVYAEDENFFKYQQMLALSMYAKLNEERKEIVDRIEESGSIYEK
ncbi:DNA polymerase beta subunit [Alkalihalophilus pseudofirmus OF4]|uniref:DNA polymerase beta subunit n=1 Tax=Alkalihalophilus pseudofirmus (strain ATCC BAA-2126 / JCM 17055 / OF4) TaxID=398511 RepID=D3FRC3_ALKPO|nr:nucleotidyltransferase domain-containing protein [Alkalihalophilus pseudofirmus]ADC51514.1 DNA polymerase beta subunit [Alkalihalophilus pseudofirmus OF4]